MADVDVKDIITAVIEGIKASNPQAQMLTGMSQDRIDRAMGKFDKPLRSRVIKGKSPTTGATMTLVVVESRSFPHGRVMRFEDYRIPQEWYDEMSKNGSIVWADPKNQAPLNNQTPSHMLNIHFKQARTDMFWKPDLAMMAGKALRPEWCLEPKHYSTDAKQGGVAWVESSLWTDADAADAKE